MARQWEKVLARWETEKWYQLFLPMQLPNGVWNLNRVSWEYGPNGEWRAVPRQQDWGDHFTPYPQDGWAGYSSLHADAEYAALRGDRFSPPTILNARLAMLELTEANGQVVAPRAGGALRLEMILDDNSRGADYYDPIKKRIFRRTVVDGDGRSWVELYVMRRVMAVRMTDQRGTVLDKDVWHPQTHQRSSNAPHFLVQQFRLGGPPPGPAQTTLLDQTAHALVVGGVWQYAIDGALNGADNRLVFPTTCSDPDVRTDPYTHAQETSGRTNRMSITDLVRLARPFHGRQSEYLKRYRPHGEYVEDAKRQMLEGGMMETRAEASLLPSLAGLKV